MLTRPLDGASTSSMELTILARITWSFASLSLALLVAGLVLDDSTILAGGVLVLLAFPLSILLVLAKLPWNK